MRRSLRAGGGGSGARRIRRTLIGRRAVPAMPSPRCRRCPLPASLRRPRTGEALCRRCFLAAFEDEAHLALTGRKRRPPSRGDADEGQTSPPAAPKPGDTLAVAASGGKDSAVLAHLLARLEARHGDGYGLVLLSVDEGIAGYREAALGAVRRARGALPLLVLSHRELFGWSVDDVAERLGAAGGSRCTFCGVLRRQALERGARLLGVDWIATGHNADDIAETVLMNFLRGDVARLRRAATGGTGGAPGGTGAVPRCKPLRHAYEKEIVLYARFRGLDYVTAECVHAPRAFRGHARALLKDLEATRATTVAALGHSGRRLAVGAEVATKALGACGRCGFAASQALCKACVLLASLERGLPRLGLGKRAGQLAAGAGPRAAGAGGGQDGGRWGCSCGGGGRKDGGHQDGGHQGGGREDGGRRDCSCGAGGHQDGGRGAGGHWDGGHQDCSCRADGHQDGGRWDGGHQDGGRGAGGHWDGGHQDCSCRADGRGAGGRKDGGHQDGGRGVCSCRAGGCGAGSQDAGGHGACSCRAGGHGAGGYGAGSQDAGGHGACSCRAGGHKGTWGSERGGTGGAGRCGAGDPGKAGLERGGGRGYGGGWAEQGVGGAEGEGAEVEVVGRGGRTVRRRVVGLGQVRGALNIWDF
ncbi:cytoplasmic tRNA 2-thiolation protein 1 [Phalacrocorax carbo]|uniref:cytoplasmic tRNA 2-thiolation protein 1 n=1 Tax=Phalacrocorax carbo TaxID=9209 RepID=UPI0031195C3B